MYSKYIEEITVKTQIEKTRPLGQTYTVKISKESLPNLLQTEK